MTVYVDGDGCPVVGLTVRLCQKANVPCVLLRDTAHEMDRDGVQVLVVDKGADSVDFALVNRVRPGDGVITQDYGLASMCMTKGAWVLHQDGWAYTQDNIGALLLQRHEAKKYRMAGGRLKGPAKRTGAQDQAFERALSAELSNRHQG